MSEPQQLINIGEVANDGTGESLRNAFNAVNNNFANVWAAGPVDSQVVITNNRISTNETNLDLVLAGNGVGNVTLSSTTVPNSDSVYDLGSPVRYFDTTYSRYYYGNGAFLTGINATGNANYSNANVAAYLPTYTGNLVSLTGPVTTTANVTGGNIRTAGTVSAAGNITGANIIAASYVGNTVSVSGNITSANLNLSGNLSIAGVVKSALSVLGNVTGGNIIATNQIFGTNANFVGAVSAVGNVTGNYFVGNGSQLTGIVASGGSSIDNGTSNVRIGSSGANVTVSVANVSNVAVFTSSGLNVSGNISASGNVTAANFIGNITGNLTVSGGNTEVLYNDNGVVGTDAAFTFDSATNILSVAGNVVADNFVGNGQALTSVMADRGGDTNNWNTLTQMGVYTVNRNSWSGTIGTPLDSQVFVGLLEVVNSTDTAIEQVFYPGTVDENNVKIQWNRAYWSGTWTGWVKIINDLQVVTGGEF